MLGDKYEKKKRTKIKNNNGLSYLNAHDVDGGQSHFEVLYDEIDTLVRHNTHFALLRNHKVTELW